MRITKPQSSRGVALIIVLFVMALGSILVINLASSTSLGAHRISYAQRGIEAEYILKSAVNLARVLIGSAGSSPNYDAVNSPWGMFARGAVIPQSLIPDLPLAERVEISLEVRPADTKIPIKQISQGTSVDAFWRDTLINLMVNLGFNNDGEVDQTGRFPSRVVTPQEMAGLIIDYMDNDTTSYEASLGEADLPKELCPSNKTIERLEDLAVLPGFTAKRLQLLEPYVTVGDTTTVNLNLVSREVLNAFPAITQQDVDAVIDYRQSRNGPFNSISYASVLPSLTPYFSSARIPKVNPVSNLFDTIAKANYGTSTYFIKAVLRRSGTVPDVLSTELY